MRARIAKRLGVFMTSLTFATAVAAQSVTGALVGTARDSSGAVLPGATVTVMEVDRGTTREVVTNAEGQYDMPSLEPGIYRVEVALPGFRTFVRDRAEVTINSTVRVDAELAPGNIRETIRVTGERPLLKTDRADLSLQIRQEQIESLPLSLDRNYQSLLELVPGVTEPAATGSAFRNPFGALSYGVNGQNRRANSDQIDGTINNMVSTQERIVIVPPAEALEAIDVSTNAYDAEHGRALGAVVNVQIKSGTNQLHGSLFGFDANSALGAHNALSPVEMPVTNLAQFGVTLGGPIRQNRTFFFGDYQGGRDRRGESALLSVPSAAYRRGDFSASRVAIYDPLTGDADGRNRLPFPGNVIPPDRISPVATAILGRLPLPNLPGQTNNYAVAGTFRQRRDAFDAKVTHRFGGSTDGFISYSRANAGTSDPPVFGDLGGPNFDGGTLAAVGTASGHRISANVTGVVSPSLLTELRVGFLHSRLDARSPSAADIAAQVGIPGLDPTDPLTAGLPRITITGYTSLGIAATLPFDVPETSWNIVNTWTKARATHTIRWGADIRYLMSDPLQVGPTRGQFTFRRAVTGTEGSRLSPANGVAAFLLGLPQEISRETLVYPSGYRIPQSFFFVQDRWQAARRVTVNYGLRYEVVPFARTRAPGGQSLYVPETNQVLVAGFGPYDLRNNVRTDWSNFAPRAGVAYRLSERTVLRAGYGMAYSPLNLSNVGNFPAEIRQQFVGPTTFHPAGSLDRAIPPPPAFDVSGGVVNSPPGTVNLMTFNSRPRRGYSQSYNVAVQRELRGFVVEAAYVGSIGTRLPAQRNLNTAAPGTTNADRPLARRFGRTADTMLFDYQATSSYHALQAKLERRFARGSMVTAAYAWSRSVDEANDLIFPNHLVRDLNRAVSGFDRTQNFVLSHIVSLPFGRGRRWPMGGLGRALLGGWQLNGVLAARSGLPVDITGTTLPANSAPGNTNRPDRVRTPTILGGRGRDNPYFDPAAFQEPAPRTWGNAGRNSVRGPGYVNYNASLVRRFRLNRDVKVQIRADAFNLTNTPHYRNPDGRFNLGSFGEITSSYGERRIRLGLRVEF